ncbi:hypothetical protein LXL04_035100 [Taraxacum kok-saghyz]
MKCEGPSSTGHRLKESRRGHEYRPSCSSAVAPLEASSAARDEMRLPGLFLHDGDRMQLNAPLEKIDPEIADIIELEKATQWKGFELIPSEKFTSLSCSGDSSCSGIGLSTELLPLGHSCLGRISFGFQHVFWPPPPYSSIPTAPALVIADFLRHRASSMVHGFRI